MVYRHLLNLWPLVPAVDIQAIYVALNANKTKDEVMEDFEIPFSDLQDKHPSIEIPLPESGRKENMNILIIGDGLGCLIKTISRMHRHRTLNLNIYVVSNFSESLVRNMLLLSLFTDFSPSMGILEKAEVFLEIFGNAFLRAATSEFVETSSANILNDIVSLKHPLSSVPVVSLSFLKQKEVDDVCKVFTFLKDKESIFDVAKAWENALRAYFGTRYDSRKNLFDYHFNMRLSHYPIINLRKYLEWCETGTAFMLRKGRYDNPNKTLCINSLTISGKSEFYGDISTSPYITFGVECKNKDMFQKVNNQYAHTSEDISKFNVIDFMTEFASCKTSDIQRKLNVYFLFYSTFCKTRKFENSFDAVYITCDMTSYAENSSVAKVLNENGIVIFETVNNVVNSTKEQKEKHVDDIERMAAKNHLKLAETLKCSDNNFKMFVNNDDYE